ncbi:hypothetical protein EWE75_17775 [Sphingomonas populi]|uniref:DUF1801 domain-containing protein n=1 Tax=Sphingomonas populi TaxID=2484750 RepID=A0A4Q6XZ71_9SPHN|nr:hypothetical protein [Sphingomonas populi]RZF63162.1 hypothetical protein EWE75_17775 [Sphingomonas populi]
MTPQQTLDAMIDRFTPAVAADARAALAMVAARLPGATRLVYDNYNALAIAFAPGDRSSQAICSVALYPRWVSLFLVNGPALPDPHALLAGGGGTMRHIRLNPALIEDARVAALLDAAAASVAVPIDPAAAPRLLIKSVSAKQRARRPAA